MTRSLLLRRDSRFKFFHLAMLLEKLIEQHRVHRFITNRVGFAFCVPRHEVRVHLLHFFSH